MVASPALFVDSAARWAVASRTTLFYWGCQALGWSINTVGQIASISMISMRQQPVLRLVLEVLLLNALAFAMTHLLRNHIRRQHWHQLDVKLLLPRIILTSILLALPLATLMHYMAIAPMWSSSAEEIRNLPSAVRWLIGVNPQLLRTINWSSVFFLWTVLYFCITSLRDRRLADLRQSELTRALQLAELRLLKSQLNPHFLFNSLNSVRALIADDPAGAQRAVTQLARTLRYTLSAGQEELVTLERELEIVADYLSLESLRLGDRLTIERKIAPEAQRVRVPVMLLQTVVENALKHGIAELPRGGVLYVSATLDDGTLNLQVRNPRPNKSTHSADEGLGLRNAAERLRLLFGDAAMLRLDLSQPDSATTYIRIPQGV